MIEKQEEINIFNEPLMSGETISLHLQICQLSPIADR